MDQRRILLAFLLMGLVLVASQWWYARIAPPPEEPARPDTVEAAAEAVAAPDTLAGPAAVGVEPGAPAPAGEPGAELAPEEAGPVLPAGGENELLADRPAPGPVRIETPLYRAWIDPRGGLVRQVELVRYPSFTTDTAAAVLVPPDGSFLRRVADLDGRRVRLDDRTWAPSDTAISLAEGDSPRTLRLAYAAGGRRVVQAYRFTPDTYVVDYEVDLGTPEDGVLVTGLGPRLHSNEKNPGEDYGQLRVVARVDGEIVSRSAGDVDERPAALGGRVDWAGLRSKYFLAAVLAPQEGPPLTAVTIDGAEGDSLPRLELAVGSPIEAGASRHRLYFGPQEYRRLASLNEGLDDVNQYGWSWIRWMITPFAKLIVVVMLWLHTYIPSYGLVLIAFGVLVRVAMWPLTSKSYRSIHEMQKLQPEIQRIRERYKDDPQRMQQETMRLYRERKVNPLGGCLPNLIPMPILFALFFVFQSTIEFRGQPFLWLPDLSQPDPLYILPVFMGATMFASSKMTTTDPKMSAMTYVMPIVLTFVFLNLAAGLVLYYAFSNLLTFGQQFMLRRSRARAEAGEGGDDGDGDGDGDAGDAG